MFSPNSCTKGSLLRSAFLTKLLISLSLSGADLAVALIMVLVCMSVSFLMHLWPWTMLQTSRGR